jgi:hypothetical protein
MTSQVLGSDFTDGALLPNYVNGRLLVAEDLATGQASLRTRDTRIGEAAGAGVVRGLWVTASGATLTVADGLGLSRAGEPVVVARPTTLQLTFTTPGTTRDQASFGCCGADTAAGTGSTLGAGILLLTARAACKLDGSAPMAPSPGSDVSPCCAAQWLVAGVEFRAIVLAVGSSVAGVTLTAGNRRNLVAHWLYGTERLQQLGVDPFSFIPAYTGLDLLDPADLTAYDVPLAAFRWDGTTVTDLDNWSARRRVTEADPVTASWSVTTADHRVSDGEARFLQFQDQAEELVTRGLARSTRAGDVFGLLPPVGFQPVDNGQLVTVAKAAIKRYRAMLEQKEQAAAEEEAIEAALAFYEELYRLGTGSAGYGFDPRVFFGSLARFGGILDWQLAEWALHQSWRAFPVPSGDDGSQSVEVLHGDLNLDLDLEESTGTDTGARETAALPGVPITYYYVLDNLQAALSATEDRREATRSYVRGPQHVLRTATLYVVFIADRRWVTGTRPPFIADQLAGKQVWAGASILGGLPDET